MTIRRIIIAVVIAGGIYGVSLGTGVVLYATGAIATGATHNDCPNYREDLAHELGVDEEDVPDEQVKTATEECLAEHELTEREAFRSEYLFWPIWPGVISAAVFLLWPLWSKVLHRQEQADIAREAANLDPGA